MQGEDMPQATAMDADAAASPLIDHAAMSEMWSDSGPALFRQIATLFDDERRRRITQLPQALAAGDRSQLIFDAHTLKGAAAYVCAPRLHDAARALEHDALSASPARLAELVAAVLSAADLTGPALSEALAAMPD